MRPDTNGGHSTFSGRADSPATTIAAMSETPEPLDAATPLPAAAGPADPGPDQAPADGGLSGEGGPAERLKPDTPPQVQALRKVVGEIELGAGSLGWDRPPSLYALVPTVDLMATPGVPEDVLENLRRAWDGTPEHLSAILQEAIGDDVEDVLPQMAWPDSVHGSVLTVERIMVPPYVEDEAPDDPDQALEFISSHPARMDVRLTIGVDREGNSWCEVRLRNQDDPLRVAKGESLVPALVEALKIGFETAETS